jgi:hypothetical protein
MILKLDCIDEQIPEKMSAIGGRIYLQIGDQFFPEEQWYDCASVLLDHWIPLITSFLHGSTQSCKLAFMDGPCHVLLRRLSDFSVAVDCFYDQKKVLSDAEIDPIQFADSLVKVGNRYCRFLHLQGRKDAAISASLQKLKQELRAVRKTGPYHDVT